MAIKKNLFGNNIEPSCSYCLYGRRAADKVMILCYKYGPVSPFYHCRKFYYDPLKREPKRTPPLPVFTADDFKIT